MRSLSSGCPVSAFTAVVTSLVSVVPSCSSMPLRPGSTLMRRRSFGSRLPTIFMRTSLAASPRWASMVLRAVETIASREMSTSPSSRSMRSLDDVLGAAIAHTSKAIVPTSTMPSSTASTMKNHCWPASQPIAGITGSQANQSIARKPTPSIVAMANTNSAMRLIVPIPSSFLFEPKARKLSAAVR